MPWRPDFISSYWLDPDWVGLSGYPDPRELSPDDIETTAPGKIERQHLVHRTDEPRRNPIAAAVIVVRDRIGFEYERQVGLDDLVSVREAAALLGLSMMTVNRWVRKGDLKSSKRGGFSVIRLRDVLRKAKERGQKLALGSRLTIIG